MTGPRAPGDDPAAVRIAPHPMVERLRGDLVCARDGRRWIRDYAAWVVELSELEAIEHADLFVELARLAHDLASRNEPDLARRTAALARIGLEPLVRRDRHGRTIKNQT